MKYPFRSFLALALVLIFLFPGLAAAQETPEAPSRFEQELARFPESYRPLLQALHARYPNWLFVAEDTGLDFTYAVSQETGTQSVLQQSGTSTAWLNKSSGYYLPERNRYLTHDAGGWVATNAAAVSYWMDPRNFLEEHLIFLFESLSFDPGYHTETGVEAILDGTFMANVIMTYPDAAGTQQISDKTYAQAIMAAAQATGVSPYYLAAKIRSEICHRDGSPSASVTGQSGGLEGLYNFYNIGAYDGPEPIVSGLTWAGSGDTYGRPWSSPEKSIIGGAEWIGASYIQRGQDTNYLQRFNVLPDSQTGAAVFTHQYMTNLNGAVSASLKSYDAYAQMNALEEDKLFRIPVYQNMPTLNAAVTFGDAAQAGRITLQGVNVRSGPGVSFGSLGVRLARDTSVTILGCERIADPYHVEYIEGLLAYPYWYRISFTSNGQTLEGYVCSEYVDVVAEQALVEGESLSLTWTLQGALPSERPYFESSNPLVATVDVDGNVTTHATGFAVINAYATGGMAAVNLRVQGTYLEGYQAGYLAGYEAGIAADDALPVDGQEALPLTPESGEASQAEDERVWVVTPVNP